MHALDPRVTSQESPAARGIKKGDGLGPRPGPPESLSDQQRKLEGEGVGLFKIEADRDQKAAQASMTAASAQDAKKLPHRNTKYEMEQEAQSVDAENVTSRARSASKIPSPTRPVERSSSDAAPASAFPQKSELRRKSKTVDERKKAMGALLEGLGGGAARGSSPSRIPTPGRGGRHE